MKIHILFAASGAAYFSGAVTNAPDDIAKSLIARGDAEPAPKGADITYDWPKPEPAKAPADAAPVVTLDTPGVREIVDVAIAKVEAENKAAFDAAVQAVTDEFNTKLADLKATAEADQAKAVEDAVAAVTAELTKPADKAAK